MKLNETIENYIDDRIGEICSSLRENNEKYKSYIEGINEICLQLQKELTYNQYMKVDKIMSFLNAMSAEELNTVYRGATKDIIEFNKDSKFF